jgi:hypothetical protein
VGLYFWRDRAAGWLVEPNVLNQISIHLSDLRHCSVSESETEGERLRAARRAFELATAIYNPEAALRLKAHAGKLLERADALDEQKGEN